MLCSGCSIFLGSDVEFHPEAVYWGRRILFYSSSNIARLVVSNLKAWEP